MKCTDIFSMGNKSFLKCLLPVLFGMLVSCQPLSGQELIDFNKLNDSGIFVWEDYQGVPDNKGVFETSTIELPQFKKGIYYSARAWPTGSNRVYGNIFHSENDSLGEGGMFLLMQLSDDRYLSVLPIASKQAYSWFDSDETGIKLKTGNHGRASFAGDLPLFSWAYANNPYTACRQAWQQALESPSIDGFTSQRYQKDYPEPFKYLGWCSWEEYKKDISEDKMIKVIGQIEDSNIPVRTFLMDDGHFNPASLKPNERFPSDYREMTRLKTKDKITWMGIWYAFLGEHKGVKIPNKLEIPSRHIVSTRNTVALPRPENESIEAFYDYLTLPAQKAGFDFVKVDFQTDAITLYAGAKHKPTRGLPETTEYALENPNEASVKMAVEFQKYVDEHFNGLINCNWHNSQSLFFSGKSVVGRCSEDYAVGNLEKARQHLYHSYTSIPWLGQIAWGDHDMFHSNDPFAGEMMAVSKAVSGGPVLLSDDPLHFERELIEPLVFNDGKLLRPLAPASPFPEDLFKKIDDPGLFRVMAPLPGNAAAVVVYNFSAETSKLPQKQSCTLVPSDYTSMTGMMQPYESWEIPPDGLVLYDWKEKSVAVFDKSTDITIEGFGHRLFQISPVVKGWAIIGQTDKYLPASAVKIRSISEQKVSIGVENPGTIGVYCLHGEPQATGYRTVQKAAHFFELIPGKKARKRINITFRGKNEPVQ